MLTKTQAGALPAPVDFMTIDDSKAFDTKGMAMMTRRQREASLDRTCDIALENLMTRLRAQVVLDEQRAQIRDIPRILATLRATQLTT